MLTTFNPEMDRRKLEAQRLERDGHYVVPMKQDRVPKGKWKALQKQRATPQQIQGWAEDAGVVGFGILAIKGIVVIDIEAAGMEYEQIRAVVDLFPKHCVRRTPSGGVHIVVALDTGESPPGEKLAFRYPDPTDVKSGVLLAETRGEDQLIGVSTPGRPPLADDFKPHGMTVGDFEYVLNKIREVGEEKPPGKAKRSSRPRRARNTRANSEPGTLDFITNAVRDGVLNFLLLLPPGYKFVREDSEGREYFLRRGATNSDTSGNLLKGVYTNHSTSVHFMDSQESLSAAEVFARVHFDGDMAAMCREVEDEAKELVQEGVAPDLCADWPHELLEQIHNARLERDRQERQARDRFKSVPYGQRMARELSDRIAFVHGIGWMIHDGQRWRGNS